MATTASTAGNATIAKAFSKLSSDDFPWAMDWLVEGALRDGYHFQQPSEAMLKWLSMSPDDAKAWLVSMPQGAMKEQLGLPVAQQLGHSNPTEALRFVNELGLQKEEETGILSEIAKQWVESDQPAAFEWVRNLEPGGQHDRILAASIIKASRSDPESMIPYLSEIQSEGTMLMGMYNVASSWGKTDPEATMNWLSGYEVRHDFVDQMIRETATQWVASNPAEASSWIDALEVGVVRDQAVAGMVNGLISSETQVKDFDAAMRWAEVISDEALRDHTLKRILLRLDEGGLDEQ